MKRLALWQVLLISSVLVAFAVFPQFPDQVSAACIQPPAGLVSWWPGDGNANDIVDGNPGVLYGGATFAAGKVGEAFSFAAPGDMVQIAHNSNLNLESLAGSTFEGWFKSSGSSYPTVIAKHTCTVFRGWFFATGQGCFIGDHYIGGWGVGGLELNDGQFHHFACVKDGTTYREYIDGALISEDTGPAVGSPVTEPVQIGKITTGICSDNQLFGLVDELAVFNKALTATEIQAIFNAGSAGKRKPSTLTLTLTGCTICQTGKQFTVQARVTNPNSCDIPVEAKVGVRQPDGTTVNLVGNKHMEVSLSAGLDTTFTLFDVPSLPDGLPTGTWTFEGTLLGPDLGETFSREVKPFEVAP